jgi:glycosyltransferase involved in cell wall biosynthesis
MANKVLMIVQNNFVNDSRVIKEANTLGENGFQVKVLALHKKGLPEIEKYEYFEVERVHLKTRDKLSNSNMYIQLIKYIEFYLKCIKIGKEFSPDIIHCHDLSPLPIGMKLKNKLNSKLIYDSHELWSHSSGVKNTPKIINWMRDLYEKKSAKKIDQIITVSRSIAEYLENEYTLEKVDVIRNIPLKQNFKESYNHFRREFNISEEEKILLYQGGVSEGRGIEDIISALEHMDEKIVFVILGNGSLKTKLKKIVKKKQLENRVYFHDAVPHDILYQYTNSGDMGISLIENKCLSYYYSLPNKMFEYIQAELPVICSDFPDMSKIIKKYKVGLTVNPKNIKDFANEVNQMIFDDKKIKNLKRNCKEAKNVLNWEEESKKLLKIYANY